jgi:ribosomal protein S3AE
MKMSNAKQKMTDIIKKQPDDATFDEIMRELAFEQMIDRGLKDSRNNRTISNVDIEHRIRTWQK